MTEKVEGRGGRLRENPRLSEVKCPQITQIDADEENKKNKIRENPRLSADKYHMRIR